jgi:hypothetical protein
VKKAGAYKPKVFFALQNHPIVEHQSVKKLGVFKAQKGQYPCCNDDGNGNGFIQLLHGFC